MPRANPVVPRDFATYCNGWQEGDRTEWSLPEAAGRDPSGIDICVVAPAYVGGDLSHQRDQLRWFGGMVGNHVVDMVNRYGEDSDKVPRVLTDYIKARESYNYDHHGKSGNPSTEFVPDDIVAQLCDALGLIGRPEDCAERILALTKLGIRNLYLMPLETFALPEREITAFRDVVFPRLRAAAVGGGRA